MIFQLLDRDKAAQKTNMTVYSAHVPIIARAEYTINLPQLKKIIRIRKEIVAQNKIIYFWSIAGFV